MSITDPSTRPAAPASAALIWRTGALAALAASVLVLAVAVVAEVVDVPLEVDGEEILLVGFVFATVLNTAIGTAIAWALARWTSRPRLEFVAITLVLTALSFIPVAQADADTATQVVLAITHVAAAAVVIPALASRLGNA